MSISEYKKKRNFKKTPEPRGNSQKSDSRPASKAGSAGSKAGHSSATASPLLYTTVRPTRKSGEKQASQKDKTSYVPIISKNVKAILETSHLKFVIQKHSASHLHYDLRLELGGVLKSWAVPKGPSLNPEIKRLAMMVEDHPMDYMLFEGTIPAGNYGAGEVIVWDIGIYHSIGTLDPKENVRLLKAGLKKGHIDFVLYGKKLKGLFSLIKIKREEENGNSWLLIKQADDYASTADVTKNSESAISTMRLADPKTDEAMEHRKPISLSKSPRKKARRPSARPRPQRK
jgi:DNA ligase D-like protein (predicted 3'-phosphoesterase)